MFQEKEKKYKRKYILISSLKDLPAGQNCSDKYSFLRHYCPWIFTYKAAKQRCRDKNAWNYKSYGAKGVKLLMNVEDFAFIWFRDKAYRIKKPQIHRENDVGHYTINNVKYISAFKHKILTHQIKNKKRKNK
jgi:hypothetical protein